MNQSQSPRSGLVDEAGDPLARSAPLPQPAASVPLTNNAPSLNLARIGKFLLATIWFGGVGAVAGHYSSLQVPVPAQFMVLDVDGIMRGAVLEVSKLGPNADPAKSKAVADAVIAKTKEITKSLADSGVVVLDRQAVVEFPPNALITLETINATNPTQRISQPTKP
jgi:hypothetical protein